MKEYGMGKKVCLVEISLSFRLTVASCRLKESTMKDMKQQIHNVFNVFLLLSFMLFMSFMVDVHLPGSPEKKPPSSIQKKGALIYSSAPLNNGALPKRRFRR